MTDADALSELVRVSLRNPARIVVKVQSKKIGNKDGDLSGKKRELVEERRIPAKSVCTPSILVSDLISVV